MKKYSEITLSDDERKILEVFKNQGYNYVYKTYVEGEREPFVFFRPFKQGPSNPLPKNFNLFDFIEVGEQYDIDKLLNPPHEPKTVWDLKEGDDYWLLNGMAFICSEQWNSCCSDLDRRNQGNVFLTKEEAEFERKRREVVTKVRKYSRPFKPCELNYFPYFDHLTLGISYAMIRIAQSNVDYFDSWDDIKKAIDEVGEDDFIKYYLGVTN